MLFGRKEPPGPLEHGADALLPLAGVAARRGEEVQVHLEFCRNLCKGHHPHPYRGEFDAQGKAAHQPADAEDVRKVFFGEGKGGGDSLSPLREELHGVKGEGVRYGGFMVGKGQAPDREKPLFLEVKPFSGSDEQVEVWAGGQEVRGQGSPLHEVLEVVEHQK